MQNDLLQHDDSRDHRYAAHGRMEHSAWSFIDLALIYSHYDNIKMKPLLY